MAEKELGFNLGGFAERWSKQTEITAKRQEEQMKSLAAAEEMNKTLAGISQQGLELKTKFLTDTIQPAVSQIQDIEAKRLKQQELLNSGSFLDSLTAWQNAMENPNVYTAEGRNKTRAEIQSQVAAGSMLNEASQQVLGAQVEVIKNKNALADANLRMLVTTEAQGLEVLKAEQDRVSLITQGLTQNATARALIMDTMTRDQLIQAAKEGVKTGEVDISGFKFPTAVINSQVAKIDEAIFSRQVAESAMREKNQKLADAAAERTLNILSPQQTEKLIAGQEVIIAGANNEQVKLNPMQFEMGKLVAAHEAKSKIANDEIQRQINEETQMDFRATNTPAVKNIVDGINSKRITPNSPLYRIGAGIINKFAYSAKVLESMEAQLPKLPDGKIDYKNADPAIVNQINKIQFASSEALAKEQAAFEAGIKAEATVQAKGSKELIELNTDYLRGTSVNSGTAIDTVVARQTTGKVATDVLPESVARDVDKLYKDIVGKKLAEKQYDPMANDPLTPLEHKREAARQALEIATSNYLRGETDRFMAAQVDLDTHTDPGIKSNPIANLRKMNGEKEFSQQSFIAFVGRSDDIGRQILAKSAEFGGLTPAEQEALERRGENVVREGKPTITATAYNTALARVQTQQLLLELDYKRPGLADEYIKWWTDQAPKFANDFTNQWVEKQKAGTLQENVMGSLGSVQLQDGIRQTAFSLSDAAEEYKGVQKKQRLDWLSYDLDPGNRQAMLLTFDQSLTDGDRQTLYQGVIAPALEMAKKEGLEFDQTNYLIDQFFADPAKYVPGFKDDAALKKALQKSGVNRGDITLQLQSMADAPWAATSGINTRKEFWNNIPESELSPPATYNGFDNATPTPMGLDRRVFKGGLFTEGNLGNAMGATVAQKPFDWYRKLRQNQ